MNSSLRAAGSLAFAALTSICVTLGAQTAPVPDGFISPSRPVPTGLAPGVKVRLVHEGGGERVYAVIFSQGDEALSGLTDFAVKYHVGNAHFTGVGAISSALTAYFVVDRKAYRPLPVNEQAEVLSLIGDIASFEGKPIVHAHVVLGKRDGTTVGGHLFDARVSPTLEVFVTADDTPLGKVNDPSGLKVIDPSR